MPRGKKQPEVEPSAPKTARYAPREPGEVEWGGFVNVRMSEEDKAKYHAWVTGEGSDFWVRLEDYLSQGMKYGLSWDGENDCFIATFTGCGVSSSASRYCLTARSDRFEDATALLVFKHAVMANEDWGTYNPNKQKFMSWG